MTDPDLETHHQVMLLLAHPRPDSFNHALADAAASGLRAGGVRVLRHDLYAEHFNPVLRPEESSVIGPTVRGSSEDPLLDQHRMEVARVDGLVVVHPNWWGKPPAILAGWLDRVLVPGVAYQLPTAGAVPEPLLRVQQGWSSTPATLPRIARPRSSATRSPSSGDTVSRPTWGDVCDPRNARR